jgi:hypothetical protein
MPYQSGLSRGDTPPKEIPTVGASPRRFFPEKYNMTRWINHRDDTGRFAQRSDTMSLDVVQPGDTLRGCIGNGSKNGPRNFKDFDPSLTTSDIYRAQPQIGHACVNGHHTIPFKHMQKPPLPEIELSKAATNYPPVPQQRPRDLSLTTWDIEYATPVTKGLKTPRVLNPGHPHYTLASSEAKPSTPPRQSGRDPLAVNDIPYTSPQKLVPSRNEYRDTMMVEDEFKSQKKKAHELTMSLKPHDIMGNVPPRENGPQKSFRASDPMDPTYEHHLLHDRHPPGTSLYFTAEEEKSSKISKGAPPSQYGTIGHIDGSKPRALTRDNREPQLSLCREDLPTAYPMRRIGSVPYSMYGPPGNRRFSTSLDTEDIFGAQADTLPRGPRMPQRKAHQGVNASMGSPRAYPASLDASDVPGAQVGSVPLNQRAKEHSQQWPPSPAAAPPSPGASSARGARKRGSVA